MAKDSAPQRPNESTKPRSTEVAPVRPTASDDRAALRRSVYGVLIALAIGTMVGRILAVNSVDKAGLEDYLRKNGQPDRVLQRAFLSSNDRSRWANVRSLVEHGTYEIDAIVSEPNWDTIDMVKHDGHGAEVPRTDPEAATRGRLYSSKPPLLATLIAGPYWIIHRATGWTLGTHPYEIGRVLLILINVLPMLIYLLLLAQLLERFGTSDWGRIFVMAAAALGTFLTTFSIVLNNHLPAAVSALVTIVAAVHIAYGGSRHWGWFAVAGFFGAFAATNELPALTLFGLVGIWMLWVSPKLTLLASVPAAAIVGAAFFGTNYLAHESWRPPYAHRQPGDNWYDYQFTRDGKARDSYWSFPERRSPVDQGEPQVSHYALHALVGHHGIFSLTPVWLLSVLGLGLWLAGRGTSPRALATVILLASVTCVTFYILRPLDDRNYGGTTSGFRWVFWFAPLWLLAMLPAADWLSRRRWTRGLCLLLLALSVMSASYPTWNPWTHPWLMNFLTHNSWVTVGGR